MKKVLKLENLGCANCAAKMEDAVRKISGVKDASVSFMTQKLILEAEDGLIEDVVRKAEKACRRIEPDCRIVG